MKLIYFADSKNKGVLKELSVMHNGETYTFPLNEIVDNIDTQIAKGLIGNWNNPNDWEKTVLLGVTTKNCPRNKLYAVEEEEIANLFERLPLPAELQSKETILENVSILEDSKGNKKKEK